MSEKKYYLKGVNGQITVFDDKVVIERKGVLGFMIQGLAGAKTIPMASIMSVQFREGGTLTNGYIQFGILGGNEGRGGAFNAASDENTVMIKPSNNAYAREIKKYIESIVLDRNNSQHTVVQKTSPADELRKYKTLLDDGIITEEEFSEIKKKLLNL